MIGLMMEKCFRKTAVVVKSKLYLQSCICKVSITKNPIDKYYNIACVSLSIWGLGVGMWMSNQKSL